MSANNQQSGRSDENVSNALRGNVRNTLCTGAAGMVLLGEAESIGSSSR